MSESERVDEMEIRMAWYERQLSELDSVVRGLFDEVARLKREVATLSEAAEPETGPASERPPHY